MNSNSKHIGRTAATAATNQDGKMTRARSAARTSPGISHAGSSESLPRISTRATKSSNDVNSASTTIITPPVSSSLNPTRSSLSSSRPSTRAHPVVPTTTARSNSKSTLSPSLAPVTATRTATPATSTLTPPTADEATTEASRNAKKPTTKTVAPTVEDTTIQTTPARKQSRQSLEAPVAPQPSPSKRVAFSPAQQQLDEDAIMHAPTRPLPTMTTNQQTTPKSILKQRRKLRGGGADQDGPADGNDQISDLDFELQLKLQQEQEDAEFGGPLPMPLRFVSSARRISQGSPTSPSFAGVSSIVQGGGKSSLIGQLDGLIKAAIEALSSDDVMDRIDGYSTFSAKVRAFGEDDKALSLGKARTQLRPLVEFFLRDLRLTTEVDTPSTIQPELNQKSEDSRAAMDIDSQTIPGAQSAQAPTLYPPPQLQQVALKCLVYVLHLCYLGSGSKSGISSSSATSTSGQLMTTMEMQDLVDQLLTLTKNTSQKSVCSMAICCLGVACRYFPVAAVLQPRFSDLVSCFVLDGLESTIFVNAVSVTTESLTALQTLFAGFSQPAAAGVPTRKNTNNSNGQSGVVVGTCDIWLVPVMERLVHSVIGVREKAFELMKVVLPVLMTQGYHQNIEDQNNSNNGNTSSAGQVNSGNNNNSGSNGDGNLALTGRGAVPQLHVGVGPTMDVKYHRVMHFFLKNQCTSFLENLDRRCMEQQHEIYAISVWEILVAVSGKPLRKSAQLNPLLKMLEKCFNSTTSTFVAGSSSSTSSASKHDIRIAAFRAWTRLVYNFAIEGALTQEKPLRLLLTPIDNSFATERNKRVRLECTTTWISLVYALGKDLPGNFDRVLKKQLVKLCRDDSEHVRDLVLRFIRAMFSRQGGADLIGHGIAGTINGRNNNHNGKADWMKAIPPGTLVFEDLGWSDSSWLRSTLVPLGLEALMANLKVQSKVEDSAKDHWFTSTLSHLGLITDNWASAWTSLVTAVCEVNQTEKGLTVSPDGVNVVRQILDFMRSLLATDPALIMTQDWSSAVQPTEMLRHNAVMAANVLRADLLNFLLDTIIDTFTVKNLISSRYRIDLLKDKDVNNESNILERTLSQAPERSQGTVVTVLSPIAYMLSIWLACGASIMASPFERMYWQVVSKFVNISRAVGGGGSNSGGSRGIVLSSVSDLLTMGSCLGLLKYMPLFKVVDGVESANDETKHDHFHGNEPLGVEFMLKYWAIVARKAFKVVNDTDEIEVDQNPFKEDDTKNYDHIFDMLMFPIKTLCAVKNPEAESAVDISQNSGSGGNDQLLDNEDGAEAQGVLLPETIYLVCWKDLLSSLYRIARQKGRDTNKVVDMLCGQIMDVLLKMPPSPAHGDNAMVALVAQGIKRGSDGDYSDEIDGETESGMPLTVPLTSLPLPRNIVICADAILEIMTVIDTSLSTSSNTNQGKGYMFGRKQLFQSQIKVPKPVQCRKLLKLCELIIERAYLLLSTLSSTSGGTSSARKQRDDEETGEIILMSLGVLEKLFNKAPRTLVFNWASSATVMQPVISLWVQDVEKRLQNCAHKSIRQKVQLKVDDIWERCILGRILESTSLVITAASFSGTPSTGSSTAVPQFGFQSNPGSVLQSHIPTIRAAAAAAAAASKLSLYKNMKHAQKNLGTNLTSLASSQKFSSTRFDSAGLTKLADLLTSGLTSKRRAIVNTTIEFWNASFGRFPTDKECDLEDSNENGNTEDDDKPVEKLHYPENVLQALKSLMSVVSITVPFWPLTDRRHKSVEEQGDELYGSNGDEGDDNMAPSEPLPSFAPSLSLDAGSASMLMTSSSIVPPDINTRATLKRLMRQKQEIEASLSPKKKKQKKFPKLTEDSILGSNNTNNSGNYSIRDTVGRLVGMEKSTSVESNSGAESEPTSSQTPEMVVENSATPATSPDPATLMEVTPEDATEVVSGVANEEAVKPEAEADLNVQMSKASLSVPGTSPAAEPGAVSSLPESSAPAVVALSPSAATDSAAPELELDAESSLMETPKHRKRKHIQEDLIMGGDEDNYDHSDQMMDDFDDDDDASNINNSPSSRVVRNQQKRMSQVGPGIGEGATSEEELLRTPSKRSKTWILSPVITPKSPTLTSTPTIATIQNVAIPTPRTLDRKENPVAEVAASPTSLISAPVETLKTQASPVQRAIRGLPKYVRTASVAAAADKGRAAGAKANSTLRGQDAVDSEDEEDEALVNNRVRYQPRRPPLPLLQPQRVTRRQPLQQQQFQQQSQQQMEPQQRSSVPNRQKQEQIWAQAQAKAQEQAIEKGKAVEMLLKGRDMATIHRFPLSTAITAVSTPSLPTLQQSQSRQQVATTSTTLTTTATVPTTTAAVAIGEPATATTIADVPSSPELRPSSPTAAVESILATMDEEAAAAAVEAAAAAAVGAEVSKEDNKDTSNTSSESISSSTPASSQPLSTSHPLPIDSSDQFRQAMNQLVQSTSLVEGMSMRDLHRLQQQLSTMTLAVGSVWGRLLERQSVPGGGGGGGDKEEGGMKEGEAKKRGGEAKAA